MQLTVKDVAPGQLYECRGYTFMRVSSNESVCRDASVLYALSAGGCHNYENPVLMIDISCGALDWEDGDLPIDKIHRLGIIDRTLVAESE